MLSVIATIDQVLDAHADVLGVDLVPYRNHAYRVANLCLRQVGAAGDIVEKVAVAAAFHDLGIWTDRTFDYLEPSAALAVAHLDRLGRGAWAAEISEMIRQHHKVRSYRDGPARLVEAFRRADWTDVTRGVLRFGAPRAYVRELYAAWPDDGFHRLLVRLELRHLARHPLNPLPVLRW